jgi:hypothetical protein
MLPAVARNDPSRAEPSFRARDYLFLLTQTKKTETSYVVCIHTPVRKESFMEKENQKQEAPKDVAFIRELTYTLPIILATGNGKQRASNIPRAPTRGAG